MIGELKQEGKNMQEKSDVQTLTVGMLKEYLNGYADDTEITFGSTTQGVPLIFYRLKTRGDNLVQIELNELN